MDLSGRYTHQAVNRIGATYQAELLRPILIQMDRQLLRLSGSNGAAAAAVSSHHDLSDLTYFDDHPQYLYLAGRASGQTILSTAAADVVLSVRGVTSQSGDLLRLQKSTLDNLVRVLGTGRVAIKIPTQIGSLLDVQSSDNTFLFSVSDDAVTANGPAVTINSPVPGGNNPGVLIGMTSANATHANPGLRVYRSTSNSNDLQSAIEIRNSSSATSIGLSWWGRITSYYTGTSVPAGGYSFAQYYSGSGKGVQFLGAVGNQAFDLSAIGAGNTVTWILPATQGTALQTLRQSATPGTLEWATLAASSFTHVMLDSAVHTDTLTGTVVLGDLIHGNGTPAWAKLAGSTVAAKRFLTQTGNGSISAVPAWSAIVAGDIPDLSATYQPLDGDLTAIAALATTSFGRSFLPLADAAAGRTLLGLGTLATQSGTFSGTSSGTNTGDQTITLTGDVTGSGTGSFAATIATAAVTLAKMANMATASFIGRNTAATGVPEVLSVATAKTMLSLTGTNSGDQTITLTGNVTGSGTGSFAATIANDAVTYAKIQNVSATDKLLGRSTAGAGDVEEIPCTAFARTILDDADAATVRATIGAGTGAGSVTSVGLSLPADLTVSGSPVTTSGTLTAVRASQAANLVLASPSGGAGVPVYRALAAVDLPTHNHSSSTTGGATLLPAQLTATSTGIAAVPIISKGFVGQTGNLIEARDSSNTLLFAVSYAGDLYFVNNILFSAGGAGDTTLLATTATQNNSLYLPNASGTLALYTGSFAAQGVTLVGQGTDELVKLSIGAAGTIYISDGSTPTWASSIGVDVGITVEDASLSIVDDGDNSKVLKFQCSGISTATTRTLTVQDEDGTIPILDPQTFDQPWGGFHEYITLAGTIQIKASNLLIYNAAGSVSGNFFHATTVSRTWELPDADTVLAGLSVPQSWTALQTFRANTIKIVDQTDATKTIAWTASGASTGADLTLAWAGTADRTVTYPNASGTLALTSDMDTARTYATLQTFKDTTWKLVDDADASKTLTYSLGGATANADLTLAWVGTVDRTVTIPDGAFTIAGSNLAQTWTAVQTFDAASAVPIFATTQDLPFQQFNDLDSGFNIVFQVGSSTPLTANRIVNFPDGSGTLILLAATQTITNKTMAVSNTLVSSSAGSGVAFTDTTTSTKKLRVVLSGAVGNSSFVISNTAARAYTFPDIAGTVTIGVATAVNGASTDLATVVALCNQLRAIMITNKQAV